MRTKVGRLAVISLIVFIEYAGTAFAETGLVGVSVGTGHNSYPEYSCGWEFTPAENIKVTKLGFWAPSSVEGGAGVNSYAYDHVITIYDSAGVEKISGTVVAGPIGTRRENDYAYVDVSAQNVVLTGGQKYVIASYWTQTEQWWDMDIQYTSLFSPGNGITLGQLDLRATGQTVPIDMGDTVNTFLSANFQFEVAPSDPLVMIESLVCTVASFNLQQGIDNSLDAKLAAALDALEDLNTNNDASAVNRLEAFIGEVEAQRGKKITNSQADSLVADAQAIIAVVTGQ